MSTQQLVLDLECAQGATMQFGITYADPDGQPIDLAGWRAAMDVRKLPTSPAALVRLTTENGRITLGATLGSVELVIEREITAEFAPGAYFYDLLLIAPTETIRLLKGRFLVDASATKVDA